MTFLRHFITLTLISCLVIDSGWPAIAGPIPLGAPASLNSVYPMSTEALNVASSAFRKMLPVQSVLGTVMKTMHTRKEASWVTYDKILRDPKRSEIKVLLDGEYHRTDDNSPEGSLQNLFYAAIKQLNERTAGTESGVRWRELIERNQGELLIQISDELPVHAARAIRADGTRTIVLNRPFVETLLKYWKKNGGVVPWLLAERIYHELGHTNHAMKAPLELAEEVDLIYWDARLQMDVVMGHRLSFLIPRFFREKHIHGFGAKDYLGPGGLVSQTIQRIQRGESVRGIRDWLEQRLMPSYERSFFPTDILRQLIQSSAPLLKYFPNHPAAPDGAMPDIRDSQPADRFSATYAANLNEVLQFLGLSDKDLKQTTLYQTDIKVNTRRKTPWVVSEHHLVIGSASQPREFRFFTKDFGPTVPSIEAQLGEKAFTIGRGPNVQLIKLGERWVLFQYPVRGRSFDPSTIITEEVAMSFAGRLGHALGNLHALGIRHGDLCKRAPELEHIPGAAVGDYREILVLDDQHIFEDTETKEFMIRFIDFGDGEAGLEKIPLETERDDVLAAMQRTFRRTALHPQHWLTFDNQASRRFLEEYQKGLQAEPAALSKPHPGVDLLRRFT